MLKIGTLLPQTGSLAFLGPPEFAGVDLAVKEINDAGGVLGEDVGSRTPTPATPRPTSPPSRSTGCSPKSRRDHRRRLVSGVPLGDRQDHRQTARCRSRRRTRRRLHRRTTTRVSTSGPPRRTCSRAGSSVTWWSLTATPPSASWPSRTRTATVWPRASRTSVEDGGGQVVADEVIYDPKAANFSAEVGKIKPATRTHRPDRLRRDQEDHAGAGRARASGRRTCVYFVDGNLSNYGETSRPAPRRRQGHPARRQATEDFKARCSRSTRS